MKEVTGGTPPYTYVWTFDGETIETAETSLKRAFGFGSHDVTLVVRDASGHESVPVTQEGYIRISSPDVYVSTTGADVWPYDTWEKATPDWNAAVGAVYATEETPGHIWVADGVYEAKDAVEFLLAGANAVAVGTALFSDPGVVAAVHDGIADYCARHGFASVAALTAEGLQL